jgi:kynurenine formamidase
MIIQLAFNKKNYSVNLSAPFDISLPLREGSNNPNCYWAGPVKFETISAENFIGSIKAGGNVNYQKLTFAPHGNGTHTECYGHLSADDNATINQSLTNFHFMAEVISVLPEKLSNGDSIITLNQAREKIKHPQAEAIIIRTLPNTDSKKTQQYSGTNPPYLEAAVTEYLAKNGVKHLLIDLPSLDREIDGGKLLAHKAFWSFNQHVRKHCTITELIFINNSIPDDLYLLNLQITSLEMDASPSKPILYKLEEVL